MQKIIKIIPYLLLNLILCFIIYKTFDLAKWKNIGNKITKSFSEKQSKVKIDDKYIMKCTNIDFGLARCENNETICYLFFDKALQCKFKE